MTDTSQSPATSSAIDASIEQALAELKNDLKQRRTRCALLGTTVFTGIGQASNGDGEPLLVPDPQDTNNFTMRVPPTPITPDAMGGWTGKVMPSRKG